MKDSTFVANHSILVVEDDVRLAKLISEYMQKHGFHVAVENRGNLAVEKILSLKPDLVILDLMLPGMSGLEICRQVRHQYDGAILMLTAQEEDVDQIVGLELGADDYVTKPVEPRVLLARMRTLLRRITPIDIINRNVNHDECESEINSDWLIISLSNREVKIDDAEVKFTTSEFDLLWYLASNAGSIVSRDALYRTLSGIEYDGVDRSMDIRVSRLRKLLNDDSGQPARIKTIRGKGYLLVLEG